MHLKTVTRIGGFIAIAAVAAVAAEVPNVHSDSAGAVYTTSNTLFANSVIWLPRTAGGALGTPRFYPTGGSGTGAGLGSQGAVALTAGGQWLIAVNAGSNNVSVFSVADDGSLTFRSKTPSGGTLPISVAAQGDTVFVLNAGGTPNITGFRLNHTGDLAPIAGASKPLAGSGPAQVSFDDHGVALVVTDKASNGIEVFRFDGGQLDGPTVTPSAGATPFGFAFGHRDTVVVSEAAHSALSSYRLDDMHLTLISPSVSDTQGAACWVVVTGNGKFAYTANTAAASVSSYSVAPNGSLGLLNAVAGSTPKGTSPIDLALSRNSQFLYSLATGTISGFAVAADGGLTTAGVVTGLPPSTVGLAAR